MSRFHQGRHTLPTDRIRCSRCHIYKPLEGFATSRLSEARYRLSRGARLGDQQVTEQLVCLECTGGPPVEMECQGPCGQRRALSEFSGNQRNNPDDAVSMCRRCVAERLNVRPGLQHEQGRPSDSETVCGSYSGSAAISTAASTIDNGASLNESVQFTSVAPGQHTRLSNNRAGMTGSGGSTTISTITSRHGRPPPVEVGASGFAKVRSGFRNEPVPTSVDDGVELASDDDDAPWEM